MGLHRLPASSATLLKCAHTQYFSRLKVNYREKFNSAEAVVNSAFRPSLFFP